MYYVTKRDIDTRWGWIGHTVTIPAGSRVTPATNQPGQKYFLDQPMGWCGELAHWAETYGFLLEAEDVEAITIDNPATIIRLAKAAKAGAYAEARSIYPVLRNRTFELFVLTADGDRVFEEPEYFDKLTITGLISAVGDAIERLNKHGHFNLGEFRFSVEGGYDGADSVRDMRDDCCEPMVQTWSVEFSTLKGNS